MRNALFHDLPPEMFPITIAFIAVSTGHEVWSATIPEGPGALEIPPLGEHGPLLTRVTYGNGRVDEVPPGG